MTYLLVSICVVLMSVAHILIKKGTLMVGQFSGNYNDLIPFLMKTCTNIYVISAVSAMILVALAWMLAISRAQLSFLYPFMALSYILVVLLSMLVFKEDISITRWVGVTVICAGVFLVSRS